MSYNNYMYAIDRSDEYLAHYGIKGIKWGIRKAIESGNSKKLDRAYKKAAKKLAKLEDRANIDKQKSLAESRNKIAKRLGMVGSLGVASSIPMYLKDGKITKSALVTRKNKIVDINDRYHKGFIKPKQFNDEMGNAMTAYNKKVNKADAFKNASFIAGGLGAASLAGAAAAKIASNKAKKRTTPKGHKAAVAERDAWRSEMNKALAGTKYASRKKQRNH